MGGKPDWSLIFENPFTANKHLNLSMLECSLLWAKKGERVRDQIVYSILVRRDMALAFDFGIPFTMKQINGLWPKAKNPKIINENACTVCHK